MAFNPKNNPLNGVKVEHPKKSLLMERYFDIETKTNFVSPARKNFLEAERRNPSKKIIVNL